MVTATLSTRVDDFLWSALRTTVTAVSNRVYPDDTAPASVVFPYVRMVMLSGQTVPVLNGTRLLGRFVYLVEAIDKTGNWDAVETASDQIYAALHQTVGAVTGVAILSCVCEEEIRRAETTDGVRYRYMGWRVRIEAVPA